MNFSLRIVLVGVLCLELVSRQAFAVRHATSDEEWARYCIYHPEPVIPMVALRKGWGGQIGCVLKINPKTGVVDEVSVVRHTHFPQLDAIMVMTLFKWRFRPGISRTTINYELGVYGRSRDYHSGMY
jgi:hypothetical protein